MNIVENNEWKSQKLLENHPSSCLSLWYGIFNERRVNEVDSIIIPKALNPLKGMLNKDNEVKSLSKSKMDQTTNLWGWIKKLILENFKNKNSNDATIK